MFGNISTSERFDVQVHAGKQTGNNSPRFLVEWYEFAQLNISPVTRPFFLEWTSIHTNTMLGDMFSVVCGTYLHDVLVCPAVMLLVS